MERVKELYEIYQGTPLEDADAWKDLIKSCHELARRYDYAPQIRQAICKMVYMLESQARKERQCCTK